MIQNSNAPPDQPGFLYLMDNTVLLKLGLATDPPKRLCAYTTENPHNEALDFIRCHNYQHAKDLEQEFAKLTSEWAWTNGNGNTTEWRKRKAEVIHKWIEFKEAHGFVNLKEWDERKPFLIAHADNLIHTGRFLSQEFVEMAREGLFECEISDIEDEHSQAVDELAKKHAGEVESLKGAAQSWVDRATSAEAMLRSAAGEASRWRERCEHLEDEMSGLKANQNHVTNRANAARAMSVIGAIASAAMLAAAVATAVFGFAKLKAYESQTTRQAANEREDSLNQKQAAVEAQEADLGSRKTDLLRVMTTLNEQKETLAKKRDEVQKDALDISRQRAAFHRYRSALMVAADTAGKRKFLKMRRPFTTNDAWFTERSDGQYHWYENDTKKVYVPKDAETRGDADSKQVRGWRIKPESDDVGTQEWVWVDVSKAVPEPQEWQQPEKK